MAETSIRTELVAAKNHVLEDERAVLPARARPKRPGKRVEGRLRGGGHQKLDVVIIGVWIVPASKLGGSASGRCTSCQGGCRTPRREANRTEDEWLHGDSVTGRSGRTRCRVDKVEGRSCGRIWRR